MRAWPGTLLLVVAACGAREAAPAKAAAPPVPPPHGILVPAGEHLQAAIDDAAAGAALILAPGEHRGPFVIRRPLHLFGPPDAVLRSGHGSTIQVQADGVTLQGFTVAGSGQRFDLMEGGVQLHGDDLVLDGVTVRDALFGIRVEGCKRALVRGCRVIGTGLPAMGLRGDGIRLWETSDSQVIGNTVTDSRDCVVWYSSRNRLSGNTVTRSRYGTHFMYSHENVVEDSRYDGNEVGVFVMYSRDIALHRNLLAQAGGAAGIGLGLKEAGNLDVTDNWFLANTTGIYIDASPLDPAHTAVYRRNTVRCSEVAVSLHSSIRRTEFTDNVFGDNGAVIQVGGDGDALGCTFAGNWYDAYQGYDFDGDGSGDVPFEFRRLSTQLEGRYPELALLHGAPSMAMVDMVGQMMPLFQPRKLLVDERPRVRAPRMRWQPEVTHAR